MGYKEQLLTGLVERGWEQVSIDADGVDWWADEHWFLRSVREKWGLEVVVTFLVDPQWDLRRKKGEGVWAVAASARLPTGRREAETEICLCRMKRRFDEKLPAFLAALDEYRGATPWPPP